MKGLRQGPIDIHAHIMPERLVRRLAGNARAGFDAAPDGAGAGWVQLGEKRLPLPAGMTDVARRIEAMDEAGIAAQLLSPWIALAAPHLSAEDGAWFADALNEAIAEIVASRPDRFAGIGSAPLQAPDLAAVTLRRAMAETGLLGVEIPTRAGPERGLDDPALAPFWRAADDLGAFVLIHPTLGGADRADFARYYLTNLVHNPLETTVAAAHLIFSGTMERHRAVKICLVHGGGYLPYGLGRLKRGRAVRTETAVAMTGGVEESWRRFLFDTVTHSPSALRFLVGEAGSDRVLLGSDYPFDMADPAPVETVRQAGLDDLTTHAVLRGNAERWLRHGRES